MNSGQSEIFWKSCSVVGCTSSRLLNLGSDLWNTFYQYLGTTGICLVQDISVYLFVFINWHMKEKLIRKETCFTNENKEKRSRQLIHMCKKKRKKNYSWEPSNLVKPPRAFQGDRLLIASATNESSTGVLIRIQWRQPYAEPSSLTCPDPYRAPCDGRFLHDTDVFSVSIINLKDPDRAWDRICWRSGALTLFEPTASPWTAHIITWMSC